MTDSALKLVDLMREARNVPGAGLAVVEALRDCAVDAADGLDERLLRRVGIAGLDSRANTLHARAHVRADVPIVRGSLDRLTGSFFC